MPIVMILNFALSCGRDFYSLKNHHKLYMWFILFYPCFYVVMVMVRGVLRVKQGENINTCYPYFFFNYQKYGLWVLVTAIIFLLIISIVYNTFIYELITYNIKKSMMMINQIFQSLLILMVLNYKKIK